MKNRSPIKVKEGIHIYISELVLTMNIGTTHSYPKSSTRNVSGTAASPTSSACPTPRPPFSQVAFLLGPGLDRDARHGCRQAVEESHNLCWSRRDEETCRARLVSSWARRVDSFGGERGEEWVKNAEHLV